MIKKLQRKFIAITMCSVILVVGGIIGIIDIANYRHVNASADEKLNVLEDNGGIFPRAAAKQGSGSQQPKHEMSPEAPFDTRYFTVGLRSDGTLVEVDTGRIAAVSTETASQYATELYQQGKTEGFQGNYKYRAVTDNGDIMYIFLDCSRELSTFYSFLWVSLLVGCIGILLVFGLVVFFSRRAVKPVAESYEKQKQFITDASHEIKTPLTIIDANTEVLEMENGENEWTGSIKKQIQRLSALTEKLVFLSRMDEEDTVLQMTDFSLSDAVEETVQPFETVAVAQEKELSYEIEKNISYYGDEASIRQLLSLLLDNAMKYTEEHGRIKVQLKSNGRHRELIVKNTVEEISKGRQDILFERFYRRDSSRNSQSGGYGIGLSVAKAIVTAHKGKITAFSEDGTSIQFTVILP